MNEQVDYAAAGITDLITGEVAQSGTERRRIGNQLADNTEVLGPLLEDEAEALHAGVWNK